MTSKSKAETDLTLFFHPRTVAVVGATDNKQHGNYFLFKKVLARAAVENAIVYAVNPRKGLTEIEGAPVVPTIADVPGDIDLVVLMVNKERIEQILTETCARIEGQLAELNTEREQLLARLQSQESLQAQRKEGLSSITANVRLPKTSTILRAKCGPMPLTRPEPR